MESWLPWNQHPPLLAMPRFLPDTIICLLETGEDPLRRVRVSSHSYEIKHAIKALICKPLMSVWTDAAVGGFGLTDKNVNMRCCL